MTSLKLTKNELRNQQGRLKLLGRYLPTLQLKKALLQSEVVLARQEIEILSQSYAAIKDSLHAFSAIFSMTLPFDMHSLIKVKEIEKRFENIAGVEVPYFLDVIFEPYTYSLFDTPAWLDPALDWIKRLLVAEIKLKVAQEKKIALEKEWREVSIRLNLFEKILIPHALANIKKITIFLGDQQLAAVCRAKVAKAKIEAAKRIGFYAL